MKIQTIMSDDHIMPLALHYNNDDKLLFTNFLKPQVYMLDLVTNKYNKLYECNTKGKLTGITSDNDGFIIGVHEYDSQYLPCGKNGIWKINNKETKVFPIHNEKVSFITSVKLIDNDVLYALDASLGNIWYIKISTGESVLIIHSNKHIYNSYYSGLDARSVHHKREYNQSGKGLGIISMKFINIQDHKYLVMSNFSRRYNIMMKISEDYKSIIGEPSIIPNKLPQNLYLTALDYNYSDGYLYIGTAFNNDITISMSHTILRTKIGSGQYEKFSAQGELNSVADLVLSSNKIIVTSFNYFTLSSCILSIDM